MGSLIGLKSSENPLQLHKHPCEMSSGWIAISEAEGWLCSDDRVSIEGQIEDVGDPSWRVGTLWKEADSVFPVSEGQSQHTHGEGRPP